MITESMMYWITRLDGINAACAVGVAISVVPAVICWFVYFMIKYTTGEEFKELYKVGWFSIIATVFCAIGLVFVPTTKEMAMIYAAPAITRSDVVQKDLPELYDMGIKALKEQLNTEK